MPFRKLLFWMHLSAGAVAGTVVFIMSVTGTLLMYEKQIVAWADERGYRIERRESARLPVDVLIANARDARGATPATFAMRADPSAPAMAGFGRDGNLFIDPYSGRVLGDGSPRVRGFFRTVTDWHRWLGAAGAGRPAARAVTGASNLAFLFLVVSGLYLWFPRTWTRPSLRAVTWFRSGLPARARNFNWHNVIGFWCAVPLLLIVVSGAVISYPWASNLVYCLAGSAPPRAPRAAGPAPAHSAPPLDGIDALWTKAQRQARDYRGITVRLPASAAAPVVFTIDRGTAGQPQWRGTLTLNRQTGQVEHREEWASLDSGRKARMWLRFVHTGEFYGVAGQTIAGVASTGAAVLVYTGLALALRRWLAWRKRAKSAEEPREVVSVR